VKLIRIARLIRRQALTYHCEIELCEMPGIGEAGDPQAQAYTVQIRQGKAGEEWRESSRTPQPVKLDEAMKLFDQLLVSRRQQGFVEHMANSTYAAAPSQQNVARSEADAVLLARIQPAVWRTLSEDARSRTVWRIGERKLAAAVPTLVGLLETGNTMLDYSLAWAIGRCKDAGATEAMQELAARGKDEKVRRIAQHAWLQLANPEARTQYAQSLVGDWPAVLRNAWEANDVDAVVAAWANDNNGRALSHQDWLEQLDLVAQAQPFARTVLLQQLRTVPLNGGHFRAIRHLYKAAEFREDGEIFGILHQRFETTPSGYPGRGGYVQVGRKWSHFRKEVVLPTSTVAYNGVTREYLRRRTWRTLRRLGEDQDASFVTMAVGALQAMRDDQAVKPYQRKLSAWDVKARLTRTNIRYFGPYSHWMLLNRLLHANNTHWLSNRTGRSWYSTDKEAFDAPESTTRSEAFPQLWDQHPDALLFLLRHAACAGVRRFAARALQDNASYCAAMGEDSLHELLTSPYPETLRFAFRICRQRYPEGEMPSQWLLLFLQAALEEARQYALECISRNPAYYSNDALLVAAMIVSADDTVRKQGRIMCQLAATQVQNAAAIVEQILLWLQDMSEVGKPDDALAAITQNILWAIENPLQSVAAQVDYVRLLALLDASLLPLRELAADWLVRHAQPVSNVPAVTLRALLESEDPNVRGVGVRLFGALPDSVLLAQIDLFIAFCTSENQSVRRAIDPALRRIAQSSPQFAIDLLPRLLDCLFRSEPAEGVHDDIRLWLIGPLSVATNTLDRDTVLRLLHARSRGAQALGASQLYRFVATDFSVREWANLARNEDTVVRAWVMQNFRDHPDLARTHQEDALCLFNSDWDDVRVFSCEYFRTTFQQSDWNPTLLVNLCDHSDIAVQRFGREMLSTHFELEHVTDYMLKLSQHPSQNMQLFVSNWLEQSAAGNVAMLTRLESYFLSVLSHVNRGRVVKNRVLAFLQQQIEHSEDIAALVARIYARQVVTVAITDKSQYIDGLRAIGERYPALDNPLSIIAPRAPSAGVQA
jgi:hypothetical protein